MKFDRALIRRIQLENDTAITSKRPGGKLCIDLNRHNGGLGEIVTEPCFSNKYQVTSFIKHLSQTLKMNGIFSTEFGIFL